MPCVQSITAETGSDGERTSVLWMRATMSRYREVVEGCVYESCEYSHCSTKVTLTEPWGEGPNSELDEAEYDNGSAGPNNALDDTTLTADANAGVQA